MNLISALALNKQPLTMKMANRKMVQQLFLGVARGWYLTLDGNKAVSGTTNSQVAGSGFINALLMRSKLKTP